MTKETKVTETKRTSALSIMGERLHMQIEPKRMHDMLKNTVFKGASDEELMALVAVANQYELNPFIKQIYAFPQKGGGVVPVVGIDGWLKIINSHPQFDGMECAEIINAKGELISCECAIYRKDRKHPTKITEYLAECIRKTEPWQQMPRRMLRHKAIMQCARVAFSICGIHDEDEAKDVERNAQGRVVEDAPGEDPMTIGLEPKIEEKEVAEELTLNNDLSLDEQIFARARGMGVPVEAVIVEAAEAKICKEAALKDLTDKEKKAILAS